jgi:hypothetical protein
MLVGIALGGWLVAGLSATSLRQVIGGAALLFGSAQLALTLRGAASSVAPTSPPVAMGVGLVAGVASTVAHSGGVVLGLYLIGRPLSSAGVVATGALAYAMSDVVKVGTYVAIGWVTAPLLIATVAATPLLYLGSWLGYRLNARLPRRAFALTLVAIATRRRAPPPAELRSSIFRGPASRARPGEMSSGRYRDRNADSSRSIASCSAAETAPTPRKPPLARATALARSTSPVLSAASS